VACVAKALGLPGIEPEAALMASHKALMRRRLRECGVPVPEFRTTRSREEAVELAAEIGFPVVIKPVDNMGARGVRRLDNVAQLTEWFPVSQENSRSGEVIIEELMTGPEVSIDTLVFDGKVHLLTIADRHIGYPPYFVETGHTLPSELPDEMQQDVFDVMKRGIAALGITHGASKGDVKVTPSGARIGEMTARMSGGYHCQYTDPLATGMNTIKAAIHLAIGEPLDMGDLTPKWDRTAAERAIIAEPGVVTEITGVDEALEIEGVRHVFIDVRPGDVVRPLQSNMGKPGHVITVGETRGEAIAAAEAALGTIRIHTRRAPVVETVPV
jgi:biotin carboxylase